MYLYFLESSDDQGMPSGETATGRRDTSRLDPHIHENV
jgi:hypothetical protein